MDRRRFIIAGLGTLGAGLTMTLPVSPEKTLLDPNEAMAASLADIAKGSSGKGSGIFNSTEIASKSFKALPQWSRVQKKMKLEFKLLKTCAARRQACNKYGIGTWHDSIKKCEGLSRAKTLHSVNKIFNRWPYKFDSELYGISEYWATPMEFLRRSGDCEDYSITKYYALRQLGFSKDELRVVIIYDNIRNLGHAVLAVYEKNDILILDSLSNLVLSHRKYRHYKPQYSMNESIRWAHISL